MILINPSNVKKDLNRFLSQGNVSSTCFTRICCNYFDLWFDSRVHNSLVRFYLNYSGNPIITLMSRNYYNTYLKVHDNGCNPLCRFCARWWKIMFFVVFIEIAGSWNKVTGGRNVFNAKRQGIVGSFINWNVSNIQFF